MIKELKKKLDTYKNIKKVVSFGFNERNNGDVIFLVKINSNVYEYYLQHANGPLSNHDPNKVKFNNDTQIKSRDMEYVLPIEEFIFFYLWDYVELRERLTRGDKKILHPYNVLYNAIHRYRKDDYNSYFEYETLEQGLKELNYLRNWFIDYKIQDLELKIKKEEEYKEGMKTKRILFW